MNDPQIVVSLNPDRLFGEPGKPYFWRIDGYTDKDLNGYAASPMDGFNAALTAYIQHLNRKDS